MIRAEGQGYGLSASYLVNQLSKEIAAPFFMPKDAVGFAMPGSLAANAIYDRIREIAHELGHLLLPAGSHSELGLMRTNLDIRLAKARNSASRAIRRR